MIPKDYMPLVRTLQEMTGRKECKWETTSDKEKFLLTVEEESIAIFHFLSFPEDEPTIGLEILNDFGEREDAFFIPQEDTDYELMWNLYWSARRVALKIEERVSGLMEKLKHMKSKKQ